jgi:rfaE bifunctional protein kinase chain/domain
MTVAVYGDHCLDRYMVGRMEAISREAPVPIVRLDEDRYSPGGGGNVAMNVRALGAEVHALGVIGDDVSGDILRRCYREAGINDELLLSCAGRRTIAFNKLYATAGQRRSQQVARFDQENVSALTPEVEAQVKRNLDAAMPRPHAVLICDYEETPGTGGVTSEILKHLFQLAKRRPLLLAADSRMRIARMGPVDLAMPNDLEAAAAAGLVDIGFRGEVSDAMVQRAARLILRRSRTDCLAVKRGGRGITLFAESLPPLSVPTMPPRGDIDVTGAGDTAMAAMVLGRLGGLGIAQAARLANMAAWVTIHKLNTTGVATPDDIRQAFDLFHASISGARL